MHKKPGATVEGRMYGEFAAWITVIGMAAALVGTVISIGHGGGVLDEHRVLGELLDGKGEEEIWDTASSFAELPPKYWFFETHICGDQIAMAGIAVACYGSIAGLMAMVLSMFRSKKQLLDKGAIFTILALVITTIMILAAMGVISLR